MIATTVEGEPFSWKKFRMLSINLCFSSGLEDKGCQTHLIIARIWHEVTQCIA
jgi:hypothetical protein